MFAISLDDKYLDALAIKLAIMSAEWNHMADYVNGQPMKKVESNYKRLCKKADKLIAKFEKKYKEKL